MVLNPNPPDSQAPTVRSPLRIGKFVIEGELGRGAMGVVYRAYDPDLARPVALKVIAAHLASPDAWARFRREAQAIARLQHANIVQVYEFGECDGSPFIAMELVEGANLHEARLADVQAGDSIRRSLQPILDVCRALECAHEHGVVHRDVKPSNIRLVPNGHARLIDFGLASLAGDEFTQSGQLLGTPAYLAPEGFLSAKVDGRADMFSLAITSFEWLTDRRPFDGGTPLQCLTQVQSESPSPLTRYLPDAPAELAAALTRAMAYDPDHRYPTMAQFREALQAAIADQAETTPLSKSPLAAREMARRPLLRDRRVQTGAAAAVVVGSLFVVMNSRTRDDRPPLPPAVAASDTSVAAVVAEPPVFVAPPTKPSPAPRVTRKPEPAAVTEAPPPPVAPAPEPAAVPRHAVIPVGTSIRVRISTSLSSERSRVGDEFFGTLEEPLVVASLEVAQRGSQVRGRVELVDDARTGRGRARLELGLVSVVIQGVPTEVRSGSFQLIAPAQSQGRPHILSMLAAAAVGPAVGGVVGGAVDAALTGKPPAVSVYALPSVVTFKLAEEIRLRPVNP